ncbi:protein TolR [Microvirga subterranea]|uniref:Cell division and transport-associated protein TolR n=1 Tax=Microvirga subterranea TaxID=186651 RepID=A0A370HJX8_9HYPH|nr:protein TolR [Microvirga subterranea]RDI58882.1 cell division and transport-associated protein TolR [Microvirga subterranea]
MGMGPIRTGEPDDEFGAAPLSEINVTPLVDVMLVLLIIFMVAAPLMTVGVPVQLPKTAAPKVTQPKQPIVVSIDGSGQSFLDKEPLSEDAIVPRLKELATQDPTQVVLVRGDRSVPYGRVIEIMGQVSAAGFGKVSLIAQAPSGAPAR